jgi:hypothetical protein
LLAIWWWSPCITNCLVGLIPGNVLKYCPSGISVQKFLDGCYDFGGNSKFKGDEMSACLRSRNCRTCPDNGFCSVDGTLTCNAGFVFSKNVCVKNSDVTTRIHDALSVSLSYFIDNLFRKSNQPQW